MIFKFRFDSKFKQKVKDGKTFICANHFKEDLHQSSSKSWIKLGCLPSLNLPEKSIPSIQPSKRRKLIRQEVQPSFIRNEAACIATGSCQCNQIADIVREFNKLNLFGWRIYKVKNMVHLTFYDNPTHHAIAKVSLLITESEDNNIFNVAFDGVYCAEVSDHLAEQNLSLSAMLAYLLNFKKCFGFENVAFRNYHGFFSTSN